MLLLKYHRNLRNRLLLRLNIDRQTILLLEIMDVNESVGDSSGCHSYVIHVNMRSHVERSLERSCLEHHSRAQSHGLHLVYEPFAT